jgi:hypothetical protein
MNMHHRRTVGATEEAHLIIYIGKSQKTKSQENRETK